MSKETISYWDGNGKYQDVQKVLWSELVPDSGESGSIDGEIVRGLGRLWHEYCNNGNGNARDDRHGERGIDGMFLKLLNTIETNVPLISEEVQRVKDVILGRNSFSQKEMDIYNALSNKCLEYLIVKRELDLDECKLKAIEVNIKDDQGTADFYRKSVGDVEMRLAITEDEKIIKNLKARIEHNKVTVLKYEGKVAELRLKYIAEFKSQTVKKLVK